MKFIKKGLGYLVLVGGVIMVPLTVSANSVITINSFVKPYQINGTTMVPLRVITENLGAFVNYDSDSKTITITNDSNNIEIIMKLNSKDVQLNGMQQLLSNAPETKNNTTMVPLRFISENLNCKVDFDSKTKDIIITSSTGEQFKISASSVQDSHNSLECLSNYELQLSSEIMSKLVDKGAIILNKYVSNRYDDSESEKCINITITYPSIEAITFDYDRRLNDLSRPFHISTNEAFYIEVADLQRLCKKYDGLLFNHQIYDCFKIHIVSDNDNTYELFEVDQWFINPKYSR